MQHPETYDREFWCWIVSNLRAASTAEKLMFEGEMIQTIECLQCENVTGMIAPFQDTPLSVKSDHGEKCNTLKPTTVNFGAGLSAIYELHQQQKNSCSRAK